MMNAFATAISIGLQYGVPLETFVKKFSYMRFDPEGMTTNPEIPFAKSLPDYIMRWLASRFLDPSVHEELGIMSEERAGEEDGRGGRAGRRQRRQRRERALQRPLERRGEGGRVASRRRPRSPTRRRSCRRSWRVSTSAPPARSAAA